jgi:hypothetical protein
MLLAAGASVPFIAKAATWPVNKQWEQLLQQHKQQQKQQQNQQQKQQHLHVQASRRSCHSISSVTTPL